MTATHQIIRSSVPGERPEAGTPHGAMYVNHADAQLGVVGPTNQAQDMLAVRFHTEEASYLVGDHVHYEGTIYRCEKPNKGLFYLADWSKAAGEAPSAANTMFEQPESVAEPRSIESKLREFKSVHDYGIYGDGVTDVTDKLNELLAELGPNAKVFMPKGTYMVTRGSKNTAFRLPHDGLTLVGEPGTVIKRKGQVYAACIELWVDDTVIRDITFDGARWNDSAVIKNCTNNGAGLVRVTIADTSIFKSGQRVVISGILGTAEANNGPWNAPTWEIKVINSTQVDLVGSKFTNAYILGGVMSMHIPACVWLPGSNNTLHNCRVNDACGAGVDVSGNYREFGPNPWWPHPGEAGGFDNKIIECHITNTRDRAICNDHGKRTIMRNNLIEHTGGEAITLDTYSEGCIIEGNTILNSAAVDINIGCSGAIGMDGAHGNRIVGNLIDGVPMIQSDYVIGGIRMNSEQGWTDKNVISNNIFRNLGGPAVVLVSQMVYANTTLPDQPDPYGTRVAARHNVITGNICENVGRSDNMKALLRKHFGYAAGSEPAGVFVFIDIPREGVGSYKNIISGNIVADDTAIVDAPVGGVNDPTNPNKTIIYQDYIKTTGGAERVSVKLFGAKGDGLTADTTAIQRALDSGYNLVFPVGTYMINDVHLNKSNKSVYFERGAKLKKINRLANGFQVHGDYNIIENMEIDGSRTTAILDYSQDAAANAICDGRYNKFINLTSYAGGQGINLGSGVRNKAYGNEVIGATIYNHTGIGVSQYQHCDGVVRNSLIYDCGLEAVTVDVFSDRGIVDNNVMRNTSIRGGLAATGNDGGSDVRITNNQVLYSKSWGLGTACHSYHTVRTIYANNHIIASAGTSLHFEGFNGPDLGWGVGPYYTSNTMFDSNIIEGGNGPSIYIDPRCDGIIIGVNRYYSLTNLGTNTRVVMMGEALTAEEYDPNYMVNRLRLHFENCVNHGFQLDTGRAMRQLAGVLCNQLARDELAMREAGYAKVATHTAEHREIMAPIADFIARFNAGDKTGATAFVRHLATVYDDHVQDADLEAKTKMGAIDGKVAG
jgi:hemerythrin